VGLPLLAITFAAIGYLLVDIGWKIHVRLAWQRRARLRKMKQRP
jgi:uncharacterized protein (DUF2062 family)